MSHYWLPDATSGTGTGNWSTTGATGHWADDAVGTNLGKAAPGSGDNVYFGANAFNGAGQVVTVNATANCLAMDWTGATNTPALVSSATLIIYGSVTFIGAMTYSGGNNIFIYGGGARNFTTNGLIITSPIVSDGSFTGTINFLDNITANAINAARGTWVFNDVIFTATSGTNGFTASGANAKTVTLGASTFNLVGVNGWNYSGSNLTLTANTATINIAGTGKFVGGGITTYHDVNLNGTAHTISGSNTFNTLTLKADTTQTITFTDGTTQTITTPVLTGSVGKVKTLVGTSTAGWTISAGVQDVICDYMDISYSTAEGGALWNAGPHSTDSGNNTGWIFNYYNYTILVDWNNGGDFYDTYDDISSDIKSVSFSRGKSDELGKAEVGQLSITLNNADGKYTPGYGGVISASLLPKRPITAYYTDGISLYHQFYGFIEEIIPHPHLSEQDCIITAVDGIDFLSRHDMSTALYKDALTGTIHGYILDDAGWSATMRSVDAGLDTVPYWYGQDVKARFAQEEIDDTAQGFSYISGNGYFNFEDRYHRSSATHQTSQGTFDNTMAYITYSLNPKNVYNQVKVTVTPWELQAEAELWRLEEIPSIDIGDTLTWWGDSQYFVDAWVTPASTTDYTANSQANGLGTDMTSDIAITTTKFAKTIKLAITNNGTVPAYITLLKARGTYYDDQTKVTRKAEDSTSQTAYQKRTLTFDGKYMDDADQAQDLADYAIGKYKDPRAELSMTIQNQDAATLTQILSREISDRITVINTKLGVSGDYFIDYMEHDISMSGLWHTSTYRLADCINEDWWCLGFSALAEFSTSGQTKLGY